MLNNIKRYYSDTLFLNSIALLLSNGSAALFGLLFWIVAARTISSHDIGLATAAISALLLITSLSKIGLDVGLIRFLPHSQNQRSLFNSICLITLATSFVLTIIFLVSIDFLSPSLRFLREDWFLYAVIVFNIVSTINYFQNMALIALRKGWLSFLQNCLLGARIPIILIIPFAGILSILAAYEIAYLIAFIIGVYLLNRLDIFFRFEIDIAAIRDIIKYSSGNYVASILTIAPITILPVLIINVLGAKDGAYFYIAYSIAGILTIIPTAASMSLFVEGSHGVPLRENIIKSLVITLIFLLPSLIIILIFGDKILLIFSNEYSIESFKLLQLLAISSIFSTIYWIYLSIKKIQKDIKMVNLISIISTLLLIILSYILMLRYGLIGMGYAWLISNVVISIIICYFAIKVEGWI